MLLTVAGSPISSKGVSRDQSVGISSGQVHLPETQLQAELQVTGWIGSTRLSEEDVLQRYFGRLREVWG